MNDDRDREPTEPTERREVRAQDPSLSPEANRILTEELREAVGAETSEVPRARPHASAQRHGGRSGLLVTFGANRLLIAMLLLGALVVGAIVVLATGSWWFLLLALAVHALGTLVIVGVILQLTSETEHLSPTAAARLEEEGVADPDALFSDLVEEHAPAGRGGPDDRSTPADEDSAQAAAEQRNAVTPSHDESKPVGP